MAFLNFLPRPTTLHLVRLPSGSFTINSHGHVVCSTLPQSFPHAWAERIGKLVLETFRTAQEAELPLSELVADYSALKLTARALRGGAIVFLSPQGMGRK